MGGTRKMRGRRYRKSIQRKKQKKSKRSWKGGAYEDIAPSFQGLNTNNTYEFNKLAGGTQDFSSPYNTISTRFN